MFAHEILLFPSGGKNNYRIPSIVADRDGVIHALCNNRHDTVIDHAPETAVVYARKRPGQDWEEVKYLDFVPGWRCMIGSAVHDAISGETFFTIYRKPIARDEFGTFTDEEIAEENRRDAELARKLGIEYGAILARSTDGGDNWTTSLLRLAPRPFVTHDGRDIMIEGMTHGSAAGIQLQHGEHKGRLLCPSRIFTNRYHSWEGAILACYNNSIYSDDHGKTWHASAPVQQGTGEGALFEDDQGVIHYNSRNMHQDGTRLLAQSTDGGDTYHDFRTDGFLLEETNIGCNASILRVEASDAGELPNGAPSITLFANPRSVVRDNMTLCISFDNGETWPHTKTVWKGGSGYSSLTYDKHTNHFFLLYEKGESAAVYVKDGIALFEFDLEWLLS